jgi:hypothetical protein
MHGALRVPGIGRRLQVICIVVLALIFAGTTTAHAEPHVAELARMLASRSDKTRLSAVLALAKLGDPAAEKPLIGALRDPNPRVRAVAATALGRLGCEAALPKLRALTGEDNDDDVRRAASNAAMKIARARHPIDESRGRSSAGSAGGEGARPVSIDDRGRPDADASARRMATGRPGVGHLAHSDEPHPALYLLINSSSDDSPGLADKATRKVHADVIKRVLTLKLRSEPSVTSISDEAQRWALEARHIDLSVTRLDVVRTAAAVEIQATLRLAISDDSGKMLSFLSGGAKVQVGNQTFDPRYLPALRREALENAMRGMFDKLLAHLHEHAHASTP